MNASFVIEGLRADQASVRERPRRVVFTAGPTIDAAELRGILPGAAVVPPIERGQLSQLVEAGFDVVAIIDGTYVHRPTLAVEEVRAARARGVELYGAASLGALRAVELRGEGMIGVGVVYDWYLRGVTARDDELVVVFDPDTHAPRNDPMINLRYACLRALQLGVLTRADADDLLARYGAYHYADRTYARLFAEVDAPRFRAFVEQHRGALDVKRRDARLLAEHLRDARWLS